MKKAMVVMLVVLMAAVTFGCSGAGNGSGNGNGNASGGGSDNGNAGQSPNQTVELKFLMWGNQAHMELYEQLIASFNDKYPHIRVNMESVPYPDYQQKVSVLAAGRELPDVAWIAERMVPQFMENDIFADVSDFQDDPEFNMSDYIPSTLDLFRKDGKLYGLPFSTPPAVMFYNKALFEQANLTDPNTLAIEGKWTWEQFENAARAITDTSAENRVYGANFFRDWQTWILLSSYSWSHGSAPFNDDMTEFTWNDQYGIETFQLLERMMFEDESHPKAGEQVAFDAGNLGMFFDVYSYVSQARSIEDFEWSIAPMPSGPQGSVPMLGQAGYVMFKDSEHPEEAKLLLKHFASQEGIQATSTFFVPPRESVLSSDEFINQPNNPSEEHIHQAVIEEMKKARIAPGHVNWQNMDNAILQGFDRLFGRVMSAEDNLAQIEEDIQVLLQ